MNEQKDTPQGDNAQNDGQATETTTTTTTTNQPDAAEPAKSDAPVEVDIGLGPK